MYLRSDENTLYSCPTFEGSCFEKRDGCKGEGRRERETPLTMPNNLISLSLWFFLLYSFVFPLKLMCLMDFPGCVWAEYYTKHLSPAVVSQPCLIFPLCIRQREILFHASFINSLLGFYKSLYLPVLLQRLKTKRDDCIVFFCGNWSQVPHHKLLLMAKTTLTLNTR